MSYEKKNLSTIPIWVRFPGLGMHYWGENRLLLIASMLGKVIRVENATLNKDRMQYARILVEMNMEGEFYDLIAFMNEDDELVIVKVEYDWKPTICVKCKQYGLIEGNCGIELTRKWVPKPRPEKT